MRLCSRRRSIQSSGLGSVADPFRGINGEQQRVPECVLRNARCAWNRAGTLFLLCIHYGGIPQMHTGMSDLTARIRLCVFEF